MPKLPSRPDRTGCNLLVILGPTASGKTRLGVAAAGELNGEIISADSRQVFRGMDIGTGKDLDEYGDVPYHLIDILDPGEEFSVFAFQRLFVSAFNDITGRGRLPVLVGGTGLYLDAVLRGYRMVEVPEDPTLRRKLADLPLETLRERLLGLNPKLHNSTDLIDRDRLVRAIEIATFERTAVEAEVPALPELSPLVFGIRFEREQLRRRITERLRARLSGGMIEEVEQLLAAGVPAERLDWYGLEYRFVTRFLRGELNRNDMFQKLNGAIHAFAKKQENWFRRMERHGVEIIRLDGGDDPLSALLAEKARREG
ncbi:tRNA (adenosine(37)-N6)-dimethylallyltransferase MiaA [Geobacter argillaceus]|uniref:tRNA dimethylallyltransferase n=1 Tax=Geobacter argillaceus TaxID=345631 RepID=A0A562VKA6_9BACT|nr:tRNA (adenosine(37)-N6)-dimethylallyltransferase MiaA [Geobacter argillaceus]TWJ18242.1 tRNA dimethylallyltransferase [Geobacter argillaceus]